MFAKEIKVVMSATANRQEMSCLRELHVHGASPPRCHFVKIVIKFDYFLNYNLKDVMDSTFHFLTFENI